MAEVEKNENIEGRKEAWEGEREEFRKGERERGRKGEDLSQIQ